MKATTKNKLHRIAAKIEQITIDLGLIAEEDQLTGEASYTLENALAGLTQANEFTADLINA